ncbi:MAG: carbon-nitrogen hydrolase family protein [Chloroflexota bacterium]
MTYRPQIRAAVVQMNPVLGDLQHNAQRIMELLYGAADQGADLVVFPECAISGYVFESVAEAQASSITIPGQFTREFQQQCSRLGVVGVVGVVEANDNNLYNSALICGPDGLQHVYRKTHLPVLGLDRFVEEGSILDTVDTPAGVLGPLICYDLRFPEAPRTLAVKGAEVLVHPTNWPVASKDFPTFVTRAAARASRVFLLSANRMGTERGTEFLGHSQIIDPNGDVLAEAEQEETTLLADIDLNRAHQKRLVHIPGVFELDSFGDRRPDLYKALTEADK